MLRLSASATTHPGLVRTANQDSVLVTDRVVAVADGMGGHVGGEVASGIAVAELRALARRSSIGCEDVAQAIARANEAIKQSARDTPEHSGMGTTLCGLALVTLGGTQHCAVFNVGDSRAYGFHDGVLARLSVDHSELAELRAAGRISPQEEQHYPRRNVITRCLGRDPGSAPDLWVFPADARDRFLICSDGLTGEVDDRTIRRTLAELPDPRSATDALLQHALSAGGRDNIAVIVVNLEITEDGQPVHSDTVPGVRIVPTGSDVSTGRQT